MKKPVFLWWAHKELWDIISRTPERNKEEALKVLRKIYSNSLRTRVELAKDFIGNCFACDCSEFYHSKLIRNRCSYCPLDWGTAIEGGTCLSPGTAFSDFLLARETGNPRLISMCAAQIRDLPLRDDVHSLYVVKEKATRSYW